MKPFSVWAVALALGLVLIPPRPGSAQNNADATKTDPASDDSSKAAVDYPENRTGVLIQSADQPSPRKPLNLSARSAQSSTDFSLWISITKPSLHS